MKNFTDEEIYEDALNLVQYGWKKEAVPIVQEKKITYFSFFRPII